jgi:glycerophosphoryl diester phosphodiesterase
MVDMRGRYNVERWRLWPRIEFDVRRTAEGELIAYHDAAVDRIPVSALARTEIAERTGHLPPLLAEVLELAAGRIKLDVELTQPGTPPPSWNRSAGRSSPIRC